MKRYWLFPLFVAATLAPAVAQEVERPFPADWYAGKPAQQALHAEMEGGPMPPLALEDWINGQPGPEDLAGKIVVVDYWAIWCAPCMASIPKKNEMAQNHADDGVVVVGVYGSRIGAEKFRKVVQDNKIAYPVGRDASGDNVKAWRAMWMPTYAVVDRKGVVRAIGLTGFDRVQEVVAQILEEQPVDSEAKASASG